MWIPTQAASRDQGLVHAYLPKFQLAGSHQIEAGVDGDWLHYNADFRRTGYEVLGLSGQLLSETLFPAPACFHVGDTEMSSYLLDTWRVSKRLQFNLGIRQDWDRRIDSAGVVAARGFFLVSVCVGPHPNLRRLSHHARRRHDGYAGASARSDRRHHAYNRMARPPGLPRHDLHDRERRPGSAARHQLDGRTWIINCPRASIVTAKYLRRRGTDGFAFVNTLAPDAPPSLLPLPNADTAGIYQLTNLRRDDYDSVADLGAPNLVRAISSGWRPIRAPARSRTPCSIPTPPSRCRCCRVLCPMPWDAPNRLLAWAYLPLPWKNWAVSALADMRTGFPFSVRDQSGSDRGRRSIPYRYPLNFDLNLAIERMVTLRGYRFALRGGVDNLTNQANPTAVNNVIGAPQFLQFLGDEGRHFVVRIRFFGRVTNKCCALRLVGQAISVACLPPGRKTLPKRCNSARPIDNRPQVANLPHIWQADSVHRFS